MKFKDKSNERIAKVVSEISGVMAEEGRGFVFSPILQKEGNHRTFTAVVFPEKEDIKELGDDEFHRFWATMSSIIVSFALGLSEEQREVFSKGFNPFYQMTIDYAFPTMKTGNIKIMFSDDEQENREEKK